MNSDRWPEWANFRTTDANGAVYFWADEPEAWGVTWNKFQSRRQQDVLANPDWRDSLQRREPKHELAAHVRREREEE